MSASTIGKRTKPKAAALIKMKAAPPDSSRRGGKCRARRRKKKKIMISAEKRVVKRRSKKLLRCTADETRAGVDPVPFLAASCEGGTVIKRTPAQREEGFSSNAQKTSNSYGRAGNSKRRKALSVLPQALGCTKTPASTDKWKGSRERF